MTTQPSGDLEDPHPFSLAEGPFVRVLERCHLTRADRTPRAWVFVVVAWGPLFVGALYKYAVGQPPARILLDLSVHVRLLVGIPLVILAERLLEARCRGSVRQLYDGAFADPAQLDPILHRVERLRDSRWIELAMLVAVIAVAQSMLWGLMAPTGFFSGVKDAGSLSFGHLWYVCVALPIAQFLMLRWLFHWVLWSYIVVGVSRLPLATIATHPDHAAGLGFLASPVSAFDTFVLAVSATIAGAWVTQLIAGTAELPQFVPTFVAFVMLVALVGLGPLLVYVPVLYRARHRELSKYNGLALDYVREFHRKWIETRRDRRDLLGTQDLQALNDLGGSFETLTRVRLVPFGPRPLVGIWVVALLPMLPLVATTMPLNKLLATIGHALLGGLPA
ncbi:MAG: hypothetical protein JWP01_2507 [Myxococcales bacterium]|nr:hypothetical protein [Myxococcales bacterium]